MALVWFFRWYFRWPLNTPNVGAETVQPPVQTCIRLECSGKKLTHPSVIEARLYTLHRGILPIFSRSSYCRCKYLISVSQRFWSEQCGTSACNTRYHPNYFVQNADSPESLREYYDCTVPAFIHVSTASFVEDKLCIYFEMQMAMSQCVSPTFNLNGISMCHS